MLEGDGGQCVTMSSTEQMPVLSVDSWATILRVSTHPCRRVDASVTVCLVLLHNGTVCV